MSTADTDAPSARIITRGITATWWYTVSGVVFFEVAVLMTWVLMAASAPPVAAAVALLVTGLLWILGTVVQLLDYRADRDQDASATRVRRWAPLLIAVAFGIGVGLYSQTWTLAVAPLAQSVMLLSWRSGLRARFLGLIVLVMAVLAVVDASGRTAGLTGPDVIFPLAFTILLPVMTVTSL